MVNTKKIFLWGSIAALLVLSGVFVGINVKDEEKKVVSLTQEEKVSVSFLNPTVTAGLDKHFIINFQPLREEFILIQKKYPQHTYIYFLYLNNAAWVGIKERDLFASASTIKVPLAIAIYKAVEDGKIKMDDTYTIDELNLNSRFGGLYKNGSGSTYTIEELMGHMLRESDNTATNALMRALERVGITDPFTDIYAQMGWEFAEIGKENDYGKINVKVLTNIFLSLYNAIYINAEHSAQVLKYLSETPFDEKIRKGVPSTIMISHKIGTAAGVETFSDCGIVYAPQRHYALCIASNGSDEARATEFMREISKAAYTYVINN